MKRSFDFSALFGVGISVQVYSERLLFLEAAYEYGLSNVLFTGSNRYPGYNVKARDIQLAAGILFPMD